MLLAQRAYNAVPSACRMSKRCISFSVWLNVVAFMSATKRSSPNQWSERPNQLSSSWVGALITP